MIINNISKKILSQLPKSMQLKPKSLIKKQKRTKTIQIRKYMSLA